MAVSQQGENASRHEWHPVAAGLDEAQTTPAVCGFCRRLLAIACECCRRRCLRPVDTPHSSWPFAGCYIRGSRRLPPSRRRRPCRLQTPGPPRSTGIPPLGLPYLFAALPRAGCWHSPRRTPPCLLGVTQGRETRSTGGRLPPLREVATAFVIVCRGANLAPVLRGYWPRASHSPSKPSLSATPPTRGRRRQPTPQRRGRWPHWEDSRFQGGRPTAQGG